MQNRAFAFQQKEKTNWTKIRDDFTAFLNDIVRNSSFGNFKDDFEIEIRKLCKKRSGQQLKAYWRLIAVIRKFMNSKGNHFSDEEVSAWVKIQAGHFQEINGQKVAKSIANKSEATIDDMKNIIDFMLGFGADYHIKDCYIRDYELDELLKFYTR